MSYIASNLRPFDVTLDTSSLVDYTYTNLDDDLATIKASNYFNKKTADSDNIATLIEINDLIYIRGSDGSQQVKVTAISPFVEIKAGLILVDAFIGTADAFALQHFFAPNTIQTDGVIATIVSSAAPLSILESTTQSSPQDITVIFSGNPVLPTLVNLMTFRQA